MSPAKRTSANTQRTAPTAHATPEPTSSPPPTDNPTVNSDIPSTVITPLEDTSSPTTIKPPTIPVTIRSIKQDTKRTPQLSMMATKLIAEAVARLGVEISSPLDAAVRRNKGKRKRDATDGIDDEPPIIGKNSVAETHRVLGLLKVNKETHDVFSRVGSGTIAHGRYYPAWWYASKRGLSFFIDLILIQHWKSIIEFQGPVYPIELIQFYATVEIKDDTLMAKINGKPFKLSVQEFSDTFHVPIGGFANFPLLHSPLQVIVSQTVTSFAFFLPPYFGPLTLIFAMVVSNLLL